MGERQAATKNNCSEQYLGNVEIDGLTVEALCQATTQQVALKVMIVVNLAAGSMFAIVARPMAMVIVMVVFLRASMGAPIAVRRSITTLCRSRVLE